MGMVVQHNISAMNANEAMRKNVAGLKKQTEKLSTGYNINRAADNAAGLAISEKMRSQIRGLTQASANANDAISLIQTAEGGLQETEDIMQRMRELSVQSANGTYTDEDREQIQYEVDALKAEVDRIAESTEYNEMKLLDGSLDGASGAAGEYGAKYGSVVTTGSDNLFQAGTTITSDIEGVKVVSTTAASGKGGENAAWSADGKTLTLNLTSGQTYTQEQIDDLVKGASTSKTGQSGTPSLQIQLGNGVTKAAGTARTDATGTVGGVRAVSNEVDLGKISADKTATQGNVSYADKIKFTSNSYGADTREITLAFDVAAGKENVQTTTAETSDYTKTGKYTLHLSTGTEYSESDIEKLLAKEGLDYSVELSDADAPDGDTKLYANQTAAGLKATMASGAGVGKEFVASTGEGLTFQIGANGVEDQRLTVNVGNMGANALGIANVSVATQDGANNAINKLDDAIKTVSTQRAKLGAVQNRLEHTVNSLNTANENMTASESQIRDTDMAAEMIKYTKSNILQQASQSMLAQANQQPQGVLQLLG
ncbi:MAG: flagellar hook protein [Ruminiclostridium sp.]|nr:flagellar hook protein [Ruminiclostridium sp.]